MRWELPGWGKLAGLFHVMGAHEDRHWKGAPIKTVRGKWHGYLMNLNLADWSERATYFLARYGELENQRLMDLCLRPGDRVVDVGANLGMLTLHAAARVGPTGCVDAFEPNPVCGNRIASTLARNRITHVRLHPMGLSDEPATLELKILLNHTGMGTLADVPTRTAHMVTQTSRVPVVTGDSVLLNDPRPVAFVKVDVEGFEVRALTGMKGVLARWRPVVTTEVIGEWLERAGSSVAELFDLMRGIGYRGFGLTTVRRHLRHQVRLAPVSDANLPTGCSDVAWLPVGGDADRKLARFIG